MKTRFWIIPFCIWTVGVSATNEEIEWYPQTPTSQFKFVQVGPVPDADMDGIASILVKEHMRILNDLNVSPTYRKSAPSLSVRLTVKVWQDQPAFARAFKGQVPGNPESFAGGYIHSSEQSLEIRMLNSGPDSHDTALHEYAHLAMMALNVNIPHNPTWLWEAVAQYLTKEKPDISHYSCITKTKAPTLAEANVFPGSLIYDRVGYLIADFIVETWNRDALVKLIVSNGNIENDLEISTEEFEERWAAFVRKHYQVGPSLTAMNQKSVNAELPGNTFYHTEAGLAVLVTDTGEILYGKGGKVDQRGAWSVDVAGKVGAKFKQVPKRYSTWYHIDGNHFKVASDTDCIFVDWHRVAGDPERFLERG